MKLPRSLSKLRRGEPEPKPEREPEPPTETVVSPEPEPPSEPVMTLVPPPPPEPEQAPEPEPEPIPSVIPLALRDPTPRSWNLWELERLASPEAGTSDERRLLLLHLRQFADPSGDLPVEFDPLVRDAFGAGLAALTR